MSDTPPGWAFARTPKWIAGHVLAIVVIAVCVLAGMWQWSRHREVSGRNDRIEARQALPPVGVDALSTEPPEQVEFRVAELVGTWDGDGQISIRNRSLNGGPGCHVVTPLVLDDDTAVLVTRGFVPLADCDDEGIAAHPPPAGTQRVTGLVRSTQTRGSFGARDAADGVLRTFQRVDIDRIDQQYGPQLLDVYVELATVEPATGDTAPIPLPPPTLDDGPHLNYTVQWTLFALVGLIGYPIVLYRQVHPKVRRPKPSGPPPRPPSDAPAGGAPRASSRS